MKPEIIRPNMKDEFYTPEDCYILESLNDHRDPLVSITRARVSPGITTQLHHVREVIERYLIISGSGEVRVGDLEPEPVGPGDVVVIPSGVPQQVINIGQEDLIFYCICTPRFTPDLYEALE